MSQSWARIDEWLATFAPPSLAVLNPPALDRDVQAAQHVIGVEFPAELVESLNCHDGLREWANIMPEQPPLSARRIAEHWQMCMGIAEDIGGFEIEPCKEPWWHPLWIPWAEGDGDAQVIDLRPGPSYGRVGMAIHDGRGDFTDSWPDLTAYLHDVSEALHSGGEVRGWYPYLTQTSELWWDRGPHCESLNGEPLAPAPVERS